MDGTTLGLRPIGHGSHALTNVLQEPQNPPHLPSSFPSTNILPTVCTLQTVSALIKATSSTGNNEKASSSPEWLQPREHGYLTDLLAPTDRTCPPLYVTPPTDVSPCGPYAKFLPLYGHLLTHTDSWALRGPGRHRGVGWRAWRLPW
jgi:hypothetical protein